MPAEDYASFSISLTPVQGPSRDPVPRESLDLLANLLSKVHDQAPGQKNFPSTAFPVNVDKISADDGWQNLSLEDLCSVIEQISPDRPFYSPNENNHRCKKKIRKFSRSTPKPEVVNTKDVAKLKNVCAGNVQKKRSADHATVESERRARRKKRSADHAIVESERRARHLSFVRTIYSLVCNFSLEKAGWPLNSTKAPTKEKILEAAVHHILIFQHIYVLMKQERETWKAHSAAATREDFARQLANGEIDWESDDWKSIARLLEVDFGRRLCGPTASQAINQLQPQFSQSQLPLRTVGRFRNPDSIAQEWISTYSESNSRFESFHSRDFGSMKRKRAEVEGDEDTTPTQPLRRVLGKTSPGTSPRSVDSSHGS